MLKTFTILMFVFFTSEIYSQCDTSIWKARAECHSGSDPWKNASDFVSNGIMRFPRSLVVCDPSYYWTTFEKKGSICITNDFAFEIRLRNIAVEDGISAYDIYITLNGNGGIGTGCFLMGESWAQSYTSAWAGTSNAGDLPELVLDLSDWTVIKLAYINNVLHYSKDGTEFYQLPYSGNICNIEQLIITFKGSGSVDWIKFYDAGNQVVYFEDFLSCNQLVNYPACNGSPPGVSLSYVAPTCNNNSLQLNASSSQTLVYSWTGPNGFRSNLQNPVITNPTGAANGTYTVTAGVNNCLSQAIQSVNVNFQVPNVVLNYNPVICEGQSYFAAGAYQTIPGIYYDTIRTALKCDTIKITNLAVKSRSFSVINQSICQGQTYLGHNTSGTYIDTLVASTGCDSIRTLHLTILPKPIPDLGIDKEICSDDSLILYPGSFSTYNWQNGSTQSHFVANQPGLYSVLVTNNCGSATDQILIKEKICDIYFPSAFTPNNDGKNDLFKILGANAISDYRLTVYNRWGQKVFETTDYIKGWDGIINGKVQNTGVFVWYCEFKKSGNADKIKMKGTVMLIR